MYASQLWWNFIKSCMQRLRVAYNFGCRARYNLPWRASVSSHDSSPVQCSIPTFQAVLRKNMHLFLERCRRSNNVMVACFDAVRLFIFFLILWTLQPHFTLWLSAWTLQCLFVCMSQCIRTLLGLDQFWNSRPTLQWCCTKWTNSVNNASVNLRPGFQRRYKTLLSEFL